MNPIQNTHANASPQLSALQHLADKELSLKSRLAYIALLLAALMMTSIVDALWLTEPALPLRTQIAFALMTVIGASWVVFAVWVLKFRRVLLAYHSVVAGRMAVTFSAIFLLGALILGCIRGGPAAYAVAMVGIAMLAAAIALLLRAHRRLARLVERRKTLEQQLGCNAKCTR